MDTHARFETKAVLGTPHGQPGLDHSDVMRAFEAFKQANDERVAEIERRMSADVLLEEKVDRINAALDLHASHLDDLERNSRGSKHTESRGQTASEHKAAFNAYVRKGETSRLTEI